MKKMNENNQNKPNNNYVIPTKVDLDKVNVNNQDNALNRERDNIISASIQANQAINEKQAKTVNNTIKLKKRNPFVSLLIGVFFIGIAGALTYGVYLLTSNYLKKEEEKYTTTTTTTARVNYFQNYITNFKTLRKFQNENTILLLLPDLAGGLKRYIMVNTSENGIISETYGTYNIVNGELSLVGQDNTYKSLTVGESSLESATLNLDMYDQEIKYYVVNNPEIEQMLIINGTLANEFACLVNNEVFSFFKYTETYDAITLDNGQVFTKQGNSVINNEVVFNSVN